MIKLNVGLHDIELIRVYRGKNNTEHEQSIATIPADTAPDCIPATALDKLTAEELRELQPQLLDLYQTRTRDEILEATANVTKLGTVLSKRKDVLVPPEFVGALAKTLRVARRRQKEQEGKAASQAETTPMGINVVPLLGAKTAVGPAAAEPAVAEATTAEATTAEATTAEAATAEATIAEATIAEPTTAEPTSAEATIAEPTTAEPTSAEATTAEPTSAEAVEIGPTTWVAGQDSD